MTLTTELDAMRKRNKPTSIVGFMMADLPITETDMQEIQAAQKKNYTNRDRMPENYLIYCDAYVEMCGVDNEGNWNQTPTNRSFSDWMQTFEEWKQEHLTVDHIKAAFIKANSEQGFPCGRPGALTNTAVALKTKATANVQPAINTAAIEYTKKINDEKWGQEMKFVPRPANVARPNFGKDK